MPANVCDRQGFNAINASGNIIRKCRQLKVKPLMHMELIKLTSVIKSQRFFISNLIGWH